MYTLLFDKKLFSSDLGILDPQPGTFKCLPEKEKKKDKKKGTFNTFRKGWSGHGLELI